MNPWISWTVCLALAGGIWLYYSQYDKKASSPRERTSSIPDSTQSPVKTSRKEERARRKATSAGSTDAKRPNNAAQGSGTGAVQTPSGEAVASTKAAKNKSSNGHVVKQNTADPEDNSTERAWAEQMSKARNGTSFSNPAANTNRIRSVKTSNEETSPPFSPASSTDRANADDEAFAARSSAAKAGDVSDMLEPRAAGPSVIRLTTPDTPQPQRAPRQPKEFQVAETKKQRQNRRKNEDRKAANQESEQARQRILEDQRRTAREARGEPARNGLQQAKAPSQSVWTRAAEPSKPTTTAEVSPTEPAEDVVDRAQAPALGYAQASVVPTKPEGGAKPYLNGLSEDQQIDAVKKLSEDESGWNTVNAKKGRKQAEGLPISRAQQSSNPSTTATANKVTNGFAGLNDDAE